MSAIPGSPVSVTASVVVPTVTAPSIPSFQQVLAFGLALIPILNQFARIAEVFFPAEAAGIETGISLDSTLAANLTAANTANPPTTLAIANANFIAAIEASLPATVKLPIPLASVLNPIQALGALLGQVAQPATVAPKST
jgi:hypothetical protein